MRHAALIYNPRSGRRREQRQAVIEHAVALLQAEGIQAHAVPTRGPGAAADQARELAEQGCDLIFACGGDGTVHEIAQAMPALRGRAVMGVLPLGTGNLLATELCLPRDPLAALRRQLAFTPRTVPLGRIEYHREGASHTRHFVVTAGIGADARLMYRVSAELKHRYGMMAYYMEMARLALIHRFPLFEVELKVADSGETRRVRASQVIISRVTSIGLVNRRLPIRTSMTTTDLAVILMTTRNPLIHGGYLTGALLGFDMPMPGVHVVHASELSCHYLPGEGESAKIYAESDGEFLGRLPVRIELVPDAMDLLMPPA